MLKLCLSQRFLRRIRQTNQGYQNPCQRKIWSSEGSIKFLQLITPVVADTHELAEEKFKIATVWGFRWCPSAFSGWTGIDIGKYDYEDNITDKGTNAVKSF